MNIQRTELRSARPMIVAAQAGFGGNIPLSYFEAVSESDEDGLAAFNLYSARMAMERHRSSDEMEPVEPEESELEL